MSAPVRRTGSPDRFYLLQAIRLAAVVLVAACAGLAPETLQPGSHDLLQLTGAFTVTALLAGLVVSVWPSWLVSTLRAQLVLDALWLTAGATLTGAADSPLHYALLLHVAAVTLLVSYRTGVVLALLDTLLLAGARGGVLLGWWRDTAPHGLPTLERLALLLAVLWVVALAASVLSVLNERELRRRRRDLDVLAQLTERMERAATPTTLARTVLEALVSSYHLRRGVVLASQDGRLPLLAAHGVDATDLERDAPSALVAQAHQQRGTVLVRQLDRATDPRLARLFPGANTLLVIPLSADARPIGALVVEATANIRLQRRMVGALQRSAAYGALALRNAWLMESVQRMAATDALTKIANRRAFEEALERELARAVREAQYVSLVMVDIDRFKALNDGLGHQAGDEVLRNAAAALACACREFDTPARYGGEEFAVILPGCGVDEALLLAERLRLAICAAPAPARVTASAGVATFPAHAADAEGLVRVADEALYASKRAGRDRTTMAEGLPPEEQMQALVRRAVRARFRTGEQTTLFPAYDS